MAITAAEVSGSKISFIKRILTLVTCSSLPTFKKQVKTFEKYIIQINPLSPKIGSNIRIRIILSTESETAVRNVKACWSRPFKMPSEMLSKYISGTIGDRARVGGSN